MTYEPPHLRALPTPPQSEANGTVPPQSEEAESEVEALAALLLTHQEAWPTHCTCGWKMRIKGDAADENGVSVTVQHAHHVAQVVLASDWRACHDAEVRREVWEAAAEHVEDECPHIPDEHPEGCCEVCDLTFALAVDFRDSAEQTPQAPAEDAGGGL